MRNGRKGKTSSRKTSVLLDREISFSHFLSNPYRTFWLMEEKKMYFNVECYLSFRDFNSEKTNWNAFGQRKVDALWHRRNTFWIRVSTSLLDLSSFLEKPNNLSGESSLAMWRESLELDKNALGLRPSPFTVKERVFAGLVKWKEKTRTRERKREGGRGRWWGLGERWRK